MKSKYILFFLFFFPYYLLWTANTKHVFVTNTGSNTVSVIDAEHEANQAPHFYHGVIHTINVGEKPKHIATGPNGRYVYVVNTGEFKDDGSVSIIDTENISGTPIATVTVGETPKNIVFAGGYAFVPNSGESSVSAIDISDPSNPPSPTTIAVGNTPSVAAKDITGDYVYVSSESGSISKIKVNDLSVQIIALSPSGNPPIPKPIFITAAPSPNSNMYVGIENISSVYVFDGTNFSIGTLGPSNQGTSRTAYFMGIPEQEPNTLYICSPDTDEVLLKKVNDFSTLPVAVSTESTPVYVDFYENNAYIVCNKGNTVDVNSFGTLTTNSITVQANPTMIAIAPNYQYGYVPNNGSNSVSVIDMATNQVQTTIDVDTQPFYATFAGMPSSDNTIAVSAEGTTSNLFFTQTEFINRISWGAATDEDEIVKYSVYRNAILIGSVLKGAAYEIDSHNCKEGRTYHYSVNGVTAKGETRAFGSVSMVTKI